MARLIALVFALTWLFFPGFGLIDLTVTWDASWPEVLEAGWGLFFTVIVGAGFVVVAASPYRAAPAIVQLYVASAALTVSAVLALEFALLGWAAAIALETALVSWLATGNARPPGQSVRVSRPLAAVALLGSGPWLVYAFHMFALNRQELSSTGLTDITAGVDHYSVQGAVGVAVTGLALLAAIWPAVRLHVGVSVGIVAVYLGLVSFKWYPTPGAFDQTWSILCMAWGVAIVVSSIARCVSDQASDRVIPPSRA